MADLDETGQSNLPAIINLTGYQIRENEDGVGVGDFSFTFPHAHPSAHNFIVLSGQDADLFEVVDNQLKLKTGQRANYEVQALFNLIASASDSGGTLKNQTIAVTVVDLNEMPTDILVTNNEIEEGLSGVIVGDLTVLDPDENDTHSFSLSSMQDGELFEIVGGQLKLREQVSADYDSSQPYYSLYITATDTEGLSMSQWLSVFVTEGDEPTGQTVFNGSLAADSLVGFSSYSVLNGGAGTDSVIYSLASDEVLFSLNLAGQLVVEKVFGVSSLLNDLESNVTVNTLVAIERLVFSDTGYALDISGDAGEVARVIISAFGSGLLNQFLSEGLQLVNDGLSVDALSRYVIENQLMALINGVETQLDFVDFVFKNVVGRPPESAELTLYNGYLKSGFYTQSSLLAFAASTDLVSTQIIDQAINLVGIPGESDGEFWALSYDLV
jgi:hypothetical protein